MNKELIKKEIDLMPEEFTLDDVIDKIILLDKIEKGIKQSEKREVLSNDELESEISKW